MTNPFESNPVIGFAFTAIHLVIGYFAKPIIIIISQITLLHIHQPPIIGELLQDGAWVMAMAAAAFTCYGVWRTHHSKKAKRH